MVIQPRSAMPENMRVATLSQEVIRRMMNTSEQLDISDRNKVVDNYAHCPEAVKLRVQCGTIQEDGSKWTDRI